MHFVYVYGCSACCYNLLVFIRAKFKFASYKKKVIAAKRERSYKIKIKIV